MEITKNENLTPETVIPTPNPTVNLPLVVSPKRGIKLPFVLIFLLAVITVIVFLSYLIGLWPEIKMKNPSLPTLTPVINKPLNLVPSSLATDSGFLKLEEDLKTLQNENSSVNLSESKIAFPNLEMNVSFEK